MVQGIYRSFVHSDERRHHHADGDDEEKDKILNGADDEIVQPENSCPIGFQMCARYSVGISKTNIWSKL